MASSKGLIIHALGRLVLREGTVREVRELSPGFVALAVAGEGLRDGAYTPGDKLQVLLPDRDMRTYSPIGWGGATELVVYRRAGDSPGARWISAVKPGDAFRFVGPQRSLAAPGASAVLFGDETSFAVAAALRRGGVDELACVFEVGAPEEAAGVLAALGISGAVLVARGPDRAHLPAVDAAIGEQLGRRPGAALLMTGDARSIQALQARRRASGAARPHRTKAYWSEGKRGLD